jgi:hypothetical protein
MSKHPQDPNGRGSLKQIQSLVNDRTNHLNDSIRAAVPSLSKSIFTWKSPLKADSYAEYRDSDFLEVLDLSSHEKQLRAFWPSRGPQWDALGRSDNGSILLVEAKANIPELSSSCSAKSAHSIQLISKAFSETKAFFGVPPEADWMNGYYQFANRLAHLHFLRNVCREDAYLIFIYFLNDTSVNGPKCPGDWGPSLKELYSSLGLGPNFSSPYVKSLFIEAV